VDSVLVFALPLVGGLLFCDTWNVTRWRVAREEGHRLYFRAVFGGAVLFCAVAMLRTLAERSIPEIASLEAPIKQFLRPLVREPANSAAVVELTITCFLTMLAGKPAAWILNAFFSEDTWLRRAIANDKFEVFLLDASDKQFPIMATMDDGKVYVGYLVQGFDPGVARKYIFLLPLMSGYRNRETQKTTFTTFYLELYGAGSVTGAVDVSKHLPGSLHHLRAEDFITVLPVDGIASCRRFDAQAYQAFQERYKQVPTEPSLVRDAIHWLFALSGK
jgi:hypothetical protein